MSGLDQILEHINNEATETASRIKETAREEAARILDSHKEEARRLENQINSQAEKDVSAATKRIQSAADLREKRMILEAKQKEIDNTISEALSRLRGLGDKEYFELIGRMIKRYSTGEKGVIRMSEGDLKRVPQGFEETLKEYSLELSDEAVNINGGFMLVYGDIQENCSFEALIDASRELLQDKIGQILFS